jgi:hypothetical protein
MKMLDGSEMPDPREAVPTPEPTPEPALPRERKPHEVPENAVLHWRIYYADGTAISSAQTTWEQAPSRNIVAIVHALNDEPAACELGTPYYWRFDDFVVRVWDPTLYLRQTGLVKFGRWAPHKLFTGAWLEALQRITTPQKYQELLNGEGVQSGCVCTHETVNDLESGTTFALYYDDGTLWTTQSGPWEKAPTDGVMCAIYGVVYSGIKNKYALRRYTYYYWRQHELRNTDDLDEVLDQFPQLKRGTPQFTGKSYRHQAEAIANALRDTLEGVR